MTSRLPSFARAAAMRVSISVSDRPTYCSGSGWRSERWLFSYSVRTGNSVDINLRSRVRLMADPTYIPLMISVGGSGGDDVVKRVALDGIAAGSKDQAGNLARGHG